MSEKEKGSAIVSICASCKKIRDDNDSWQLREKYIEEHPNARFARFSHAICPECIKKIYPELYRKEKE
ncbi:MAG: hypothetical protein JRI22_23700 [Deltaproteobacteria bacterium]|nr:hypothetical protein [Deltaproteobacteria bacterium]